MIDRADLVQRLRSRGALALQGLRGAPTVEALRVAGVAELLGEADCPSDLRTLHAELRAAPLPDRPALMPSSFQLRDGDLREDDLLDFLVLSALAPRLPPWAAERAQDALDDVLIEAEDHRDLLARAEELRVQLGPASGTPLADLLQDLDALRRDTALVPTELLAAAFQPRGLGAWAAVLRASMADLAEELRERAAEFADELAQLGAQPQLVTADEGLGLPSADVLVYCDGDNEVFLACSRQRLYLEVRGPWAADLTVRIGVITLDQVPPLSPDDEDVVTWALPDDPGTPMAPDIGHGGASTHKLFLDIPDEGSIALPIRL